MGEPIPVVADVPTARPGLGFGEYVEALADAIRGGTPPQFTLGIYGPWGSGKSSILHAVHRRLDEEPDVTPVYFDAWRHEKAEHIVLPLLYEMHRSVAARGPRAVADQLRKALQALVAGLNFRLIDVSKVKAEWSRQGDTPLDEAFSKPFGELRALPETLGDHRIAVLIDDLDRCSDANVVSVLEAINLVMDVPGLIFALALDYDVLVQAIERKYEHVSGHVFIEKLVQIPFRVPPLTIHDRGSLRELLPDWESHTGDLPDHFSDRIVDIAVTGLRGNPRQVKRLLNSFLVLRRIIERRRLPLDPLLLAALIGLQLRWPQESQRLHEELGAALGPEGDGDPFERLVAEGSADGLAEYAELFFRNAEVTPYEAWRILQLTAVVSAEGEIEADPFAIAPEAGS